MKEDVTLAGITAKWLKTRHIKKDFIEPARTYLLRAGRAMFFSSSSNWHYKYWHDLSIPRCCIVCAIQQNCHEDSDRPLRAYLLLDRCDGLLDT
eukprot:scaffold625_cov169-Skeletonema_dohrnii-CCMP3373.AAC.14